MKPLHILLIEDDADDQYFFKDALGEIENAALIGVANNGLEALDMLRDPFSLPDVIFSDIHMPGMDGLQCLIELRKNARTKDIPVVMLSSDTSKAQMACYLGATAFIKKATLTGLRQQLKHMIALDLRQNNVEAYNTFAAVSEL
jgi:CheY-like chemotaxis protein